MIGGPRFYERAEIKDAIAYLQAIDNPYDAVSLTRIANKPRRGVGDTSLARLQALADGEGISLWEALGRAEEAGLATASLRAVQSFRSLLQSLMAQAQELSIAGLVERVIERTEYREFLLAGLPKWEAEGKIENLEELVGVAREYEEAAEEPSLSSFLQEISLYSDQDALRDDEERRPGDADDPAQREGPRVPRRLHARDGGGDLPALALDRGELARGGAAPLLRRHDAGEGAADDAARDAPLALRPHRREPAVALPRRAARGGRRARAAARRRRGPATATPGAPRETAPRADVPSLSTGDAVRHQTLGAGHRDADRAGRRRDGALRGRGRAAADARVRAARGRGIAAAHARGVAADAHRHPCYLSRAPAPCVGQRAPGGVHVHHLVVGIVLALVAGMLDIALRPGGFGREVLAFVFGAGAAFILDEFALSVHLRDVYWTSEGRSSIEVSLMWVLLGALLLVGISPFGIHDSSEGPRIVGFTVVAVSIVLSVVTCLKGKLTLGLLSIFLPPVGLAAAMRLARPGSVWASVFYRDDPGKQLRGHPNPWTPPPRERSAPPIGARPPRRGPPPPFLHHP